MKFLNYRINTSLLYLIVLCFIGIITRSTAQEENQLSMIIDADTANEIDDLYAIVRAVVEPKFYLLGITSAQFHTSPLASDSTVYESQKINEKILQLMNRNDIPTLLGSNNALLNVQTPSISEASTFIINEAHKIPENKRLTIVILGSCTNVASAILQDPSIIPKLSIHYIGFWHDTTTNVYDKKEFNTGNDPIATNVLLNEKGLDFNVMTATTSQHLVFDKKEADLQLKGKAGIANYLIDRWETYQRWWTKEDPEKKKWIMWDVAIIEALANPKLSEKKQFLTPSENTQRQIGIYTSIKVNEMIADFWKKIAH